MKQTLFQFLPRVMLGLCLISAVSTTGCTGVEAEPQGIEAVEEEPSEEYLKGEQAIE